MTCTMVDLAQRIFDGCGLETKNISSGLQYQESYHVALHGSGSGLNVNYPYNNINNYVVNVHLEGLHNDEGFTRVTDCNCDLHGKKR